MPKPVDAEVSRNQTTRHSASLEGPKATDLRVPALTVLAHPDADRVGEMAILPDLAAGQSTPLSRLTPLFAQPGRGVRAALEDSHLSRQPLRLLPSPDGGEITLARAGSSTRVEVDGEVLSASHTFTCADLDQGAVIVLGHRIVLALHLHHPVPVDLPSFGLIGESTALAASELFGAARGAFTGAVQKRGGYFLRAHQGTLFLDEIGDTPLDVQPLLLRVLESGEIQPVGADAPQQVDVRLISATDADLEERVASRDFRQPLLHRLAGYEIHVPPLRQRPGDFGRLFFHFLRRELSAVGIESSEGFHHDGRPWPPADLVGQLARHAWPGNVRQLENAARRLAISRCSGGELGGGLVGSLLEPRPESSGALPRPELTHPASTGSPATGSPDTEASKNAERYPAGWRPAYRKPSEIGEDELLAALREHRFELKSTAAALRVSRGSLYNLVQENPRVRKQSELTGEEIEGAVADADGDLEGAALRLEISLQGLKLRMKALGLR